MANLRFSPGLLSSIRDFGSSLTEAPASRANTLTGAGVQPASLGGMLARNVGGLMGRDMRTPQEKLSQALAQVDPNSPDAEEQQLAALVEFGSPTQQVQAVQRLTAQRKEREAKSEEERQLDGYNSIATLARTESTAPDFLSKVSKIAKDLRLDPVKVNELIKSNAKGIKTETVADGTELVRINDDGSTTLLHTNKKDPTPKEIAANQKGVAQAESAEALKTFLPLYRLSENQKNALSKNIDAGTIKTTDQLFKNIGKYDSRALTISEATIGELSKYQKQVADAGIASDSAGSLINRIEKLEDLGAGAPATVEETLNTVFGTRDAASEARTAFNKTVNEGLIAGLPPGVASDKDIELLQRGFPPESAGRQEMLNYLAAYKRTLDSARKYNSFKAQYISNNNTIQNLERDATRYRTSSRDASIAITGIISGASGKTSYNSAQPIELQQAQRIEALVENFNSVLSESLGSEYTSDFVTPNMLDSIRGNPEIEKYYSQAFRRNYLSN